MSGFKQPERFTYSCQLCQKEFSTYVFSNINRFRYENYQCPPCVETHSTELKKHLLDIFNEFRSLNSLYKKIRLLTDEEFNNLFLYLQSVVDIKSPSGTTGSGQWARAFLGLNGGSIAPVMIQTSQAQQIIDYLNDKIPEDDIYKFIHAFGSCILYPHDLERRDRHGILRYYLLHHRPTKKEDLFYLWSQKFYWLHNCDTFIFSECSICLDNIGQRDEIIICTHCGNLHHVECLHKNARTQRKNGQPIDCPLCRGNLNSETVKYVNFEIYQMSSDQQSMKILTFEDHINN